MKTVTVPAKAFWASKLFLLGATEFVVGVIELVQTNVLGSEEAAWGAVLFGAATMALRLITKRPVAVTDGKPVQVQTPTATISE